MCGIAGYFQISNRQRNDRRTLEMMIYPVLHRGPDGFGFYLRKNVGLAHARLSIVDLAGGWQPITNEDRTIWLVFNGEIFNYPELREGLVQRGHIFETNSDTEVIIHLYEEKGKGCLADLNGQFALAIYDANTECLFLARDRMGIRPLYYTLHNGSFYFASEVKSLFNACPDMPRRLSYPVLTEIFTYWSPAGAETVFSGVKQLPPGHLMEVKTSGNSCEPQAYWTLPFCQDERGFRSEQDYAEELLQLMIDSVKLRLRADVPVGAYLSGGLDSSTITSLVRNYTTNPLKTFSVTFQDRLYDESNEQFEIVEYLNTEHHRVDCSYRDIADIFPEVIWHTESPILRTAPAPLFLLSKLVRENNYKVVLTGEGADEILCGYDLFKESKIRAFVDAQPDSMFRRQLLKRLYPYLGLSPTKSSHYASRFFDVGADSNDLFYGHRPRWKTTAGTHVFLTEQVIAEARNEDGNFAYMIEELQDLSFLNRAQYLECKVLMANYLLSSQGDRMAMAHSVEGRFPFLDHRVVEFSGRIPDCYKMKVLNEKNILKLAMKNILPDSVLARKKRPYMAPDIASFFGDTEPEYLEHYVSEKMLTAAGLFKPEAVSRLMSKCRKNKGLLGFRENMAFVGILSTQIVYDKYIKNFHVHVPEELYNVKVLSE